LEIARNTSRHSKATRFYLNFQENKESIEFEIGDDGIGGVKPKDFRFGLASIDELLIKISSSYSSSSKSDGSSFKFQIRKSGGNNA
jgi:signal transduction histidine kinase